MKYIRWSGRQIFTPPLFVQDPDNPVQETLSFEGRHGAMSTTHMTVERILTVGRVLYYLEKVNIIWEKPMQLPYNSTDKTKLCSLCLTSTICLFMKVENPQRSKRPTWHKVLSKQRKRAVVACLRMAPLYNLPRCSHVICECAIWTSGLLRLYEILYMWHFSSMWTSTKVCLFVCTFLWNRHRAVNLFIQGYNMSWVSAEDHSSEEKLIEDLAMVPSIIWKCFTGV